MRNSDPAWARPGRRTRSRSPLDDRSAPPSAGAGPPSGPSWVVPGLPAGPRGSTPPSRRRRHGLRRPVLAGHARPIGRGRYPGGPGDPGGGAPRGHRPGRRSSRRGAPTPPDARKRPSSRRAAKQPPGGALSRPASGRDPPDDNEHVGPPTEDTRRLAEGPVEPTAPLAIALDPTASWRTDSRAPGPAPGVRRGRGCPPDETLPPLGRARRASRTDGAVPSPETGTTGTTDAIARRRSRRAPRGGHAGAERRRRGPPPRTEARAAGGGRAA